MGPAKMVALVFAITTGVSYRSLCEVGIRVAKNTWTRYLKDVGMVLSEHLERERRDPENKYWYAQWDEVVMGKRQGS